MSRAIPRLLPEEAVFGASVLVVRATDVTLTRPTSDGMVSVWHDRVIGPMRAAVVLATNGAMVQVGLSGGWTAWVHLDRLAKGRPGLVWMPAPRTLVDRLLRRPVRWTWTLRELRRLARQFHRQNEVDASLAPFDTKVAAAAARTSDLLDRLATADPADAERVDQLTSRLSCLLKRCTHPDWPADCDSEWSAVAAGPSRWQVTSSSLAHAGDLR